MRFVIEIELPETHAQHSAAAQKLLKELADHCKGMGTALERYRSGVASQTISVPVKIGTVVSETNRAR